VPSDMTIRFNLIAVLVICVIAAAFAKSDENETVRFGLGRAVGDEEIAAWDIDIMPDGTGLPVGSGTVKQGEEIYNSKCAQCHGQGGVDGPSDRLVGRIPGDEFPFALDPKAPKTIGSYWPYATTVFDYTRRAMPFDAPGSLTDGEVYSLVAYLLYLNEILPRDTVLNERNLATIKMPARGRFVPDDRKGGQEIR
jgi:cytochrome c